MEPLEDAVPFSLEALDRYLVCQELAEVLLAGNDAEGMFEELQQKGGWPLGYSGRLQFEQLHSELEYFAARVKMVDLGPRLDKFSFEVDIDSNRLSGVLGHRCEKGQLIYRYGDLRGRDLLQGWLVHLVADATGKRTGPTRIVLKNSTVTIMADSGDKADLRGVIDLYLDGCRQPSRLYTEAAYAYCTQTILNRSKGRTEPLVRAIEGLDRQIERGYLEELSILFTDPRGADLLDKKFVRLCREFFLPIMEQVEIDSDR